MNKKVIVSVVMVSILVMIPLFTASAGQPEHIVLDVDVYWEMADCGDFIIQVHNWGKTYVVIDWEAMRATLHSDTETSIYRTVGVGPTYSTKGAFVQVYRLGKGKGQMDLGGVPIVVPGAGVILINAGRIYYDNDFNVITLSGNQQLMEGDIGKLCAAFR